MNRQQLATENALRILPSHGWTAGWIGRRDRALIVLAQHAELPYERIAELSAGDISFADGEAIVAGPDGDTAIAASTDGLLCAPCALARWLHALDLTVVYTDTKVIASVIGRAAPLTSRSPHVCENPQPISAATRQVPALPAIDRWGILAPQPLSSRPHPRSHHTRGAGPVAAHRLAAPIRSPEEFGADHHATGSWGADQVSAFHLRRDPGAGVGAGTRAAAPAARADADVDADADADADAASLRAGELERRLRDILDRVTGLDN